MLWPHSTKGSPRSSAELSVSFCRSLLHERRAPQKPQMRPAIPKLDLRRRHVRQEVAPPPCPGSRPRPTASHDPDKQKNWVCRL